MKMADDVKHNDGVLVSTSSVEQALLTLRNSGNGTDELCEDILRVPLVAEFRIHDGGTLVQCSQKA